MNNYLKLILLTLLLSVILSPFIFKKYSSRDLKKQTLAISIWNKNPEVEKNIKAFKKHLAALGYIEGDNLVIHEFNPERNTDLQKTFIQSMLAQDIDAFYLISSPGTEIAKSLTSTVPIIFSQSTYPKELGLVKSNQNSGNNLVGVRNWVDFKIQLSNFRKLVPVFKKIGFIHKEGEPLSEIQYLEALAVSKNAGFALVDIGATDLKDLELKLKNAPSDIDVFYSSCDFFMAAGGHEVAHMEAKLRNKPDFTCSANGVRIGGLIATIVDSEVIGRLAAEKFVQVLKGANPSSLETSTPSTYYILLNRTRAKELNLYLPPDLLNITNEQVE